MRSINLEGEITNLTLYLAPTAMITGHVVIESGDANNVFFQAYRKRSIRGHERWIQVGGAATNSDGVFKMYDLEAPASYVLCNHLYREQAIVTEPGKMAFGYGYPSQCYPSGLTAGVDVVNLSAGQQAEVEIPLTRQRFYKVTIAEPNYPLGGQNGINIQIMQQNGLPVDATVRWNQETRTAETYLPNGNYYAVAQSWGKSMSYGRVDFKVADLNLPALRLLALPLVPVPVELHKEFTDEVDVRNRAGAVGFSVIQGSETRRFTDVGLQLQLMPVDRITETDQGMNLHYPDGVEDGNQLESDGVTPGRYWVRASYFRGGYVSAITSGGADLTKEPLVVGAGNTVAPIQVTVRNDGGQINCSVNSPPLQSPAQVRIRAVSFGGSGFAAYAIPVEKSISRVFQAGAGINGEARITNLAPGTYTVIAFDGYRDLGSMDTNELTRLSEKGKTVTVTAGETVNVQIELINNNSEEQSQ
jgi:hypothetical protein